jgi:hypothetical protein
MWLGCVAASVAPFALGGCSDRDADPRAMLDADAGVVCTSCGACEDRPAVLASPHTLDEVTYPELPPTSGPHDPCWAPWGVHETEVRTENWVHNLEHGGVAFLYDCPEGCDAEVAELAAFVNGHSWALLMPYADGHKKFSVVAWGTRLESACFDMDALSAFYETHVNRAPESISSDPPAVCAAP